MNIKPVDNTPLTRIATLFLAWSLLAVCTSELGQGTKNDYDRAAALPRLTRGKVFRDRVDPHWFDDGRQMWYKVSTGPREWEFVLVNVEQSKRAPAFDHQRLSKALLAKKIADAAQNRLPIENLDFDVAGKHVDLSIGGRWWRCDLKSYELSPRPGAAPVARASRSGLRPLAGAPRASKETGEETTVTFVNRTSAAVELFWLDTDGKRQSYGRLRPGEERSQHTFAGHVWLVTDSQGRPLGVKVAEDTDATVDIGDKEATDRKNPQSPPTDSDESVLAPGWHDPELQAKGVETYDSPFASSERATQPEMAADATGEPPQAQAGRQRRRSPRRASSPRSPDGRWEAFLKDHNVFVRDDKGEEFALSRDGTTEDDYGPRFYWSPDSRKLLAIRTKHCEERKVYFVESSPRDQVQPKLHSNTYVKPGDPLPIDRPQLFDLQTKKPVPMDNRLYENPWSIGDYRWAADSSRFTFVFNQRGHQVLRLLSVNAATGAVRAIIDEHSPTFIDYSGKFFLNYVDGSTGVPAKATVPFLLAQKSGQSPSNELIWMSERDGWNHLYLYDANTGKVKNQITKGPWVVRGVDRVDEAKRQIWFRAGGIHPEQDPYYIHYCRVNFDGSGLTVLTAGDGTHKIDFSPDGKTFLDAYSRVDMPPVTELRRSEDGNLVCSLEKGAMDALLYSGWQTPERFVAKGRDGETDIYGVIFRPTNFDPHTRYPIIEQIYAGPQDSFVPKNFHAFYPHQALAELGFIVVQIDGMGTSNRSKKFHDVCWKNLADAGLLDRILWIKAAAKKYPFMDLKRVGIYGGSAGGQSAAAAVMTHGDFYKVAVADCGCHDNRMDKIWWNEQWMGWPIGPEYQANSNVTLASGLKGKLLLIVAEMDTNVDPASTMQVVNALIRADKDFELLVVPGSNHGAAESPYGRRRRADFFVRNLLGVEPRK